MTPSLKKGSPLKTAKEGQRSKPSNPRKRQSSARISAACKACKRRKTKCTGGPAPCQLCKSLGTPCVIDLSLDMRRRAAFQRTVDENKLYQETLDVLIENIRDGPSAKFELLIHYIRTGASAEEITQAIQNLPNLADRRGDYSMNFGQHARDLPSEITEDLNTTQPGINDPY